MPIRNEETMITLEQRVARLEKSCRYWRMLAVLGAAGLIAVAASTMRRPAMAADAANAANPTDAAFAHITARQLDVQDGHGPVFSVLAEKEQASMRITDAAGNNMAVLMLDKDGTHLILSRQTKNGMSHASIGVDDLSGSVAVRGVDGKSKDLLP